MRPEMFTTLWKISTVETKVIMQATHTSCEDIVDMVWTRVIRWDLHSSLAIIFPGRTEQHAYQVVQINQTQKSKFNQVHDSSKFELHVSAACLFLCRWHGDGQSACLAAVAVSAAALSQANWTARRKTHSKKTLKYNPVTNKHALYIYITLHCAVLHYVTLCYITLPSVMSH